MMPAITEKIWQSRYRCAQDDVIETDVDATFARVARAVASIEHDPDAWFVSFRKALDGFHFLPGGRVLAGAGTGRRVTLFNCFVAGPIEDSMNGILNSLKETALTMQQGGGIGIDFSGLRPSGDNAVTSGTVASGPVSFMRVWDALCETLLATSNRRGAMMGTLRCDHPDIVEFIDAKRQPGVFRNFCLSVLASDAFMTAVRDDAEWALLHPAGSGAARTRMAARSLWRHIVEAAWEAGEPGLLFIDRMNRENNLHYLERINATNPCGEVPLPPYGACNLGSINLAAFISNPFTSSASLERELLRETVAVAVRLLDNVIDISGFPLRQQAEQVRNSRRIGLGVTGLADALVMLGYYYGSEAGRECATDILRQIRDTAYETSIGLAREKGAFPLFDKERFLDAPFVRRLPARVRAGIAAGGIRNSHLLAIAPAGTISLLAGNVSSGVEPIYALEAERNIRDNKGRIESVVVRDFAYDLWLRAGNKRSATPDVFEVSHQISARAQLEMQGCLQPFVDSAISKTINLGTKASVNDVADAFMFAWSLPLKGCTVFRQGARDEVVLKACGDARRCDDSEYV